MQIDADGSGTISAEELVEFMSWKSTTPPGSGAKRRVSEDDQSHLPFVAEFIAVKSLIMREGASIHSPKVGRIAKGEIVAVMRAVGNRLRVERLRVNVQPRRGWVTEWDDRAGEAFLEMLPRGEWGDSAYNDTVSRRSPLGSVESDILLLRRGCAACLVCPVRWGLSLRCLQSEHNNPHLVRPTFAAFYRGWQV